MAYCSSTGKFASLDEPEVEIDSEDVSESGVTFEVRVTRPCAECGDDSATYETTLEHAFEHECKSEAEDDDEPEFEIVTSEGTCEETSSGGRYAKRLFSVRVDATISCSRCGEEIEISVEETGIAASSFPAESH